MNYKIDWANIVNGYKGFESLAVKYVQAEYDSNFEHTKDTRDGNKDAISKKEEYTIILGYQPSPNVREEWWMEAKYSESKKILPRYRLDATLVSAILKGNVGRIIFVTNMNIQSQTINDIRQAITDVTVCKEVNFCTRNTLEYWLYQHLDILQNFFPDYHHESIELDDLMLVENIKYYSAIDIHYTFRENLCVLDLGQIYRADFAVFSKDARKVSLASNSYLKGIKFVSPKKVALQKGINNIQFYFMLKSNYGYSSVKRKQEHNFLPEPSFTLDSLHIVSEGKVAINKQALANYKIASQEDMKQNIRDFFHKAKGTNLYYLYGHSGVGKSYVLSNYISSKEHFGYYCLYCEMSGIYTQDLQNLIDCINYIYFPYLPSDGITAEYLKNVQSNNYLPPLYLQIIKFRDDMEQLSKLFVKYITESITLFPRQLYINQRQIIVDNAHKASATVINVLYKITAEQSMLEAPFRFIFSGQWIQHTDVYSQLCAITNVQEKELRITVDDCLNLLSDQNYDTKLKGFMEASPLFSNIIELLLFSVYLREHNQTIQSFEDFLILYHLFFANNMMDLYIKHLFDNAVKNDEKAAWLCNQVYWNASGMPRTDTEEEHKLLCCHLIKLDATAKRVIPYHDLYAKCYRKNYVYSQLSGIPFIQLLEYGKFQDIQSVSEKIQEQYKQKNYILVYYTLEPVFREGSSIYKNRMDETTYFTLFHYFAHACAFCSIDISGYKIFEQIYSETKKIYHPTAQIQLIRNAALWELTNSTFESLKYEKALNLCKKLLEDTSRLVEYGIMEGKTVKDSVHYHNARVIQSIIKSEMSEKDNKIFFQSSEQQMIDHNMNNRLWSFRVRYSLSIMQQKPYEALQLLQKCHDHYEALDDNSEKYYLWSSFYASYIKMIISKESSKRYQEEIQASSTLEKIKDMFFNDYRKMLYGIVLYLYYCNRKEEADLYLLSDCHVLRDKRPRLKGFEHLILALRHIKELENLPALAELQKAYAIFRHIPSYGNLIKHNINLIESDHQKTYKQIEYYLGGTLKKDIYYLDIRGCW